MSPLTESTRLTLAKGQPVPNDPYLYTNTVLLLHGDGTNGSTNIVDSSKVAGSPKAVTAVGNAQISTAQSKFGGSSIAFSGGTSSWLSAPDVSALALLSSDFTFELWAYFTTSDNEFIFWNANSNAYGFRVNQSSSTSINLLASTNGSSHTTNVSAANALQINTWQHIAVSRSGSSCKIFVNGLQVIDTTITGALANGGLNQIGGRSAFPTTLNGYIDDLRITKGVARYTSNFTPPTLPFPDF
jgi:hypothetical protein